MTAGSFLERVRFDSGLIWKARRPQLESLDIELTERCNNNCVHCCINLPMCDAQAEAREMDIGRWQEIIRDAVDLGVLSIRYTGGEPLLREDFASLYEFTRRLGVRVSILTNARLVTQELCALLARIPPMDPVEVTVYGMSAGTYEAVSQVPGSFDEFRRGVDLLLENGIPLVLKWVMLPQNAEEHAAFLAWAATVQEAEAVPPLTTMLCLRTRRDSEARNREISSLRMDPEEVVDVLSGIVADYRRETLEFCVRFSGSGQGRLFCCGATRTISVDAYGVLQPCLLLRMPEVCYDLARGTIRDAMTQFFPIVRGRNATNPEYLARCARCFLQDLCEQCPAKSWAEHGSLDTPVEYFCAVAHAEARRVGLLGPDEFAWEVSVGSEQLRGSATNPDRV